MSDVPLNGSQHQIASRDYGAVSHTPIPDVTFSPTEFMTLGSSITTSLNKISSNCRQMEKILKYIGSRRDTVALREKAHAIQYETNTLILAATQDRQRLIAFLRMTDKQQRLQIQRLTDGMKAAVNKYSDVQQRLATAMRANLLPKELTPEQDIPSEQLESEKMALLKQNQSAAAAVNLEHDIQVERGRLAQQIESDLLDVNFVMHAIGELVQDQGPQTEMIESNIERVATDVEASRDELANAAAERRSHRRKVVYSAILSVILGIIVAVVVIMYLRRS